MVLVLFSYVGMAPSTLLYHTVDCPSKAKTPSNVLWGKGKEGKEQNLTHILNEICFRICIFRNLPELEAEESLYPCLREIFSDNKLVTLFFGLHFCLSIYLVKFPHVCQARVRLSVTCPIFQVFLGALSFVYFAKALAEGYLKSTITQIERRFDIPSSLVGVIDGSFEIGRYCRCLVLLLCTRSSRND